MKFGKQQEKRGSNQHFARQGVIFTPGQTPTGLFDTTDEVRVGDDVAPQASDETSGAADVADQVHEEAVPTDREDVSELLGEVLEAAKKGHERRKPLSDEPDENTSTPPPVVGESASQGTRLPDLAIPKKWLLVGGIVFSVLFLALSVTVVWLVVNRQGSVSVIRLGGDGVADDGTSLSSLTNETLFIDGATQSVGIAAAKPQGLQVASSIGTNPRGKTNVRLGILNDAPYLVFENGQGAQWQIGMAGDTLQYGKVGEQQSSFGALQTPAPAIGFDRSSVLTIQGTKVLTPNNLSFDDGTLFIDATNNRVAIGSNDANGYKLYVAGSLGVAQQVVASQVFVGGGSAGSPGYSFNGAGNSGIFGGAGNVSITVGGSEVLRVQSGAVIVQNADLNVSGYIRAGGGPAWQLKRITGTLNGSGEATLSHGVSSGATRIVVASAWYQGWGDARQLAIDSYDNSSITVAGGLPNRPFRLTIIYAADSAGW